MMPWLMLSVLLMPHGISEALKKDMVITLKDRKKWLSNDFDSVVEDIIRFR